MPPGAEDPESFKMAPPVRLIFLPVDEANA